MTRWAGALAATGLGAGFAATGTIGRFVGFGSITSIGAILGKEIVIDCGIITELEIPTDLGPADCVGAGVATGVDIGAIMDPGSITADPDPIIEIATVTDDGDIVCIGIGIVVAGIDGIIIEPAGAMIMPIVCPDPMLAGFPGIADSRARPSSGSTERDVTLLGRRVQARRSSHVWSDRIVFVLRGIARRGVLPVSRQAGSPGLGSVP